MYAYIKGTLTQLTSHSATLDVQGVGYILLIPLSVYKQLISKVDQTITLHTDYVVREDSIRLFGFLTPKERDIFINIRDVSGIGPKTALSIIGHLTLPELTSAVATKDIATLTRIPGIGKKSAERLALDLKDRLPTHTTAPTIATQIPLLDDAISALINLGYQPKSAKTAIEKVLDNQSFDQTNEGLATLITAALKKI
ncbi:MAG: Holliday junction ATP-dependent DNA helicase RuvA [Chlamydiia bacterium]|nr:Holliday junction ATP-dependent DNA helicase RuvA [Chlamydiia bacterium]